MNNPVTGHQALVAAFMSALVRQELIALLILVGLTAFWMVLREWRPDLARPLRGPAVRTGVADPGHGEPSARRLLRIGFGALWLFDGVLQVQPGIPSGLPTRVIIPAAATSPHWVRTLAGWAASAWTHHPVQASTSVVWIQLGIGIWLLTTPHGAWSRLAGLVSACWSALIWVFGEAFGGLFTPGAALLTGAPGAALFYCAAGLLLALPDRSWRQLALGRRLLTGLGVFFGAMAVLQAWRGSGPLARMAAMMARTSQPAPLARLVGNVGAFTASHGLLVNALAVTTLAVIGLGLASHRWALLRPVVVLTAVACLADWVLVQDLGFLGGLGTDPNSMIPLLLLVLTAYVAVTRVAPDTPVVEVPKHSAIEGLSPARLAARFASLNVGGVLGLWAAILVPFGPFPQRSHRRSPLATPRVKRGTMRYLTTGWSFDPFEILVLVLVVWHEIGLARLAPRSRPERTRQRRLRSLWFYGGLAVLLIAVASPVDYWAARYFFVHMIEHLLLGFAAPVLIVAGAPWQPLLAGLPGELGKDATREVLTGAWARPLRAAFGWVRRPWVTVALFNAVMVFWHLPGPFDLADRNDAVHIWLMHGSYFGAGVLFWLLFIPSVPLRITMSRAAQMAALMVTNLQMWILAMSMSILTSSSWYSVYDHVPGVRLAAFADQQIGGAILWVCGDFWAIPALVYVVRRMIAEDGNIGAAVERMLGRGSRRYQWAGRR